MNEFENERNYEMNCNGTIWVENEDGTYDGAMCIDVDLAYWSDILEHFYTNKNKVKALVDLVMVYRLGRYVRTNLPHTLSNPVKDITLSLKYDDKDGKGNLVNFPTGYKNNCDTIRIGRNYNITFNSFDIAKINDLISRRKISYNFFFTLENKWKYIYY